MTFCLFKHCLSTIAIFLKIVFTFFHPLVLLKAADLLDALCSRFSYACIPAMAAWSSPRVGILMVTTVDHAYVMSVKKATCSLHRTG